MWGLPVWLSLFFFLLVSPFPVYAHLYINEVLPNPSTAEPDTEWLELYNASSSAITLTRYSLVDADGHRFIFSEATVAAFGYFVVYGSDGLPSLNNTGDQLSLLSPQDQLLDQLSYSSSSEDQSWARVPDGGPLASQPQPPTPAQPNPTPSPSPPPSPTPSPTPSSTSTPTPDPQPPSPSPTLHSASPLASSFTPPPLVLALASPEVLSASDSATSSISAPAPPPATSSPTSPVSSSPLFFIVVGFSLLLTATFYFFLYL